jgi:hypothetical protein
MAEFEYSSTTASVRDGFKDLRAVWKCVLCIKLAERSSLNAAIPASLQSPSRSAPVNSSVHSAISQRSTSSPSFIFRVWMRRISYRPSTSGGGTYRTCSSMGNYSYCIYRCKPHKERHWKIKIPYQNALGAEEQHQLHLDDL